MPRAPAPSISSCPVSISSPHGTSTVAVMAPTTASTSRAQAASIMAHRNSEWTRDAERQPRPGAVQPHVAAVLDLADHRHEHLADLEARAQLEPGCDAIAAAEEGVRGEPLPLHAAVACVRSVGITGHAREARVAARPDAARPRPAR